MGCKVFLCFGPDTQSLRVIGKLFEGKLVWVCLEQGYMVAVEMAENDISSAFDRFYDFPPDRHPGFYLAGVGKQGMPLVSQGDARINEYPPFSGRYQAAHPAYSQRFRADYLKVHGYFQWLHLSAAGGRAAGQNATSQFGTESLN